MIATILDYGAGNLHSLAKALSWPGVVVRLIDDPLRALDGDLLVLPGVGSFPYAAQRLASARVAMRDAIAAGLPTIGICLGMQLLFARSQEGPGDGLGVIGGTVTRLLARRVPHIGWNSLESVRDRALLPSKLTTVYYANSFACRPDSTDDVIAWTTHETDRFPAAIRRGRVAGLQFHPEKSSSAGVAALRAVVNAVTS